MLKKKHKLWVIVNGEHLCTGSAYTKESMIREHVRDHYIIPSVRWPDRQTAWEDCRRKGYKAIQVNIEYTVKEKVKVDGKKI